jgi:hypothetical protein
MRVVRTLAGIALLAGLLTCGESTRPAGPGWLDVHLTSPNADDGGVMFRVQGGPIDSVRSTLPHVFAQQISSFEWTVIVVGDVTSTVIAQVWIPDLDTADRYSATLEQAASGTTFVQRNLGGYSLELVP